MSKYAWPWDQDSKSWSLAANPRYQVRDFKISAPRYDMLIHGHVVDSAGTAAEAFAKLECTYEYEEHRAELELARLRLRQARERITSRFPAAARDGQLASILEGLDDALGRGPEAAEPESTAPDLAAFDRLLGPDLAIGVDGSANIVLVVTNPRGKLLRVVTVGDVGAFKSALDDARTAQHIALDEAEGRRITGLDDKRRSEGRLTRSEAVEWLTAKGPVSRQRAVHMTRALSEGAAGGPLTLGMQFEDGYWVVPVNTEQTAR